MAGEKNDRNNAALVNERPWAREPSACSGACVTARPGEVRVRVNAVALNYRDKMVIEGTMPIPLSFPFTPASDMAGVVDSIGEGVTRFKPGARVISTFFPEWIDGKPQADARDLPYKTSGGYFQGMLAEYVIVSENALVASPESLDDAEASTLPCAGLTAWFALVERGHLRAGQSVLVQGTGGVALFALQIAKAHGAEVIVTSGSDEKLALAKSWEPARHQPTERRLG